MPYQVPLSLWRELLRSPHSERTLHELLADALLERIPHLMLRRAADDALRLRLAFLATEDPSSELERLSSLAASRLQDALDRAEAASDRSQDAARSVDLLCQGRTAEALLRAQAALPPSQVLQAALYALDHSALDPVIVLSLLARSMPLPRALALAGLFARRSWWSANMRDFATDAALRNWSLSTIQDCLDPLGWAQLNSLQQHAALAILKSTPTPSGLDARRAALRARGVYEEPLTYSS